MLSGCEKREREKVVKERKTSAAKHMRTIVIDKKREKHFARFYSNVEKYRKQKKINGKMFQSGKSSAASSLSSNRALFNSFRRIAVFGRPSAIS